MATGFYIKRRFTAPVGGVVKGTAYLIGALLVVARASADAAAAFTAACGGVWTLPKTTGQAWTEGQPLYWNDSTKKLTSAGTAGYLVGVAAAVAASGATTGSVLLNGVAPATSEGPQTAVTALTDSSGTVSNDSTIADGLTATAPSAITGYTAVVNMSDPVTKAQGEAVSAALDTLQNEVTALQVTVAACVTDLTVQNQNDSDLAAKVNEIRAALIAAGILASS